MSWPFSAPLSGYLRQNRGVNQTGATPTPDPGYSKADARPPATAAPAARACGTSNWVAAAPLWWLGLVDGVGDRGEIVDAASADHCHPDTVQVHVHEPVLAVGGSDDEGGRSIDRLDAARRQAEIRRLLLERGRGIGAEPGPARWMVIRTPDPT